MAATLDDALKALTELVDLAKVGNTIANASYAILRHSAPTPAPSPAAVPPPLPAAPTPAATYPVLPPIALPARTPSPVPPVPSPTPGPAKTPKPPKPRRGPFGRLWARVAGGIKNRVKGLRAVRYAKAGAKYGRATGLAGGETIGAAIGGAAGGALAVVGAFKSLYSATVQLTDKQMAFAKQLADAGSGSMAAVMAEREIREMTRDIRIGEETSGSARDLMEAEQRRKDATAPLTTALTDIGNEILAFGNDVLSTVLEPIGDAVEAIRDEIVGPKAKPEAFGLAALEDDVRREANRIEAAGARMMAAVRADAAGAPAPAGAARPGMLP